MFLLNNIKSVYLIIVILIIFIPSIFVIGSGYLLPQKPVIKTSDADQYISISGSKIRYEIYKGSLTKQPSDQDKPVLILLHGFGNYKEQWGKVIPALSYHTVIGLDMIGFGGSDTPAIPYTLESQRKYLLAFMDELGIEVAILAGISMGASVSAWSAANSPERIHSAIMFAPSAYPGSLSKKWPYSWLYQPGIINKFIASITHSRLYRALYPDSMGAQALDVTSSYNSSFANALDKIKQSTLIAWSTGDKTTLYQYSREYRKRIKNLSFIKLDENVGHNILRHAPERTATIINHFLINPKQTSISVKDN